MKRILITLFIFLSWEGYPSFSVGDGSGKFYKSDFYGVDASSSNGGNSGLAWLRGDYDYSGASGGVDDVQIFDKGPQYQAPAGAAIPSPQVGGGYAYQSQNQPAAYQQQHQLQQQPQPQYQQQQPQHFQNQFQQQAPPGPHQQYPPNNMRGPLQPQTQSSPQQPTVMTENIQHKEEKKDKKDKNKPNSWLFGGEEPAPTFSAEDERIRQEKFSRMKTKFEIDDEERRKQQSLTNREGSVILDKAYVDRDELVHGMGKRIGNNFEVIPEGKNPAMYVPQVPQYQQQPPQPDLAFVKPRDYYKGKINPDEGTKWLQETYAIPPRKMKNRRKSQQNANKPKGRSHALDDPPAEIINDVRWFDDDEQEAGNGSKNTFAVILNFSIALTLVMVL